MRLRAALVVLALSILTLPSQLLQSANAAAGDTDTSMYFNGTSQAAQIADASALDLTGDITIEAWVYPINSSSSNSYQVLNKESAYELYTNANTWTYALSGGTWNGVNTGIPVRNNEWQHVAFTRAAGSSDVYFYFNGKMVYKGTSDGVGTGSIANTAYPLQIGARSGNVGSGFSSFLNGNIDEVRLYSSVRTAANIVSDMHSYGPVNDVNLVLYLDMNDVSGSTLVNRSTSAAASGNLTLYNSPTTSAIESTTTVSGKTVVTFPRDYLNSKGGWKAPVGITNTNVLVVGAGGGGGAAQGANSSGGGGGGQVRESSVSISDYSYNQILVGTGGQGGTSYSTPGYLGETSTAFGITSSGGGGGSSGHRWSDGAASAATTAFTGGGGSGFWSLDATTNTGAGTSPRKGGNGRYDANYGDGQAGGGGAGAGGNGGDVTTTGTGGSIVATGGVGGSGVSSSLQTGSAITYGGGGGGGKRQGTNSPGTGTDGGGNGGYGAGGIDGANNRGGGGGGAAVNGSADSDIKYGGKGGNGVVILSYTINLSSTSSVTVPAGNLIYATPSSLTATSNQVGKIDFKANGKYIPGCRSLKVNSGNSFTANCSYKPITHGYITITAIFTPTDSAYSGSSASSSSKFVLARTSKR